MSEIRTIEDARAFYRQDEFGQNRHKTTWRSACALAALISAVACAAWLATSCAPSTAATSAPDVAALQAAIDTQCTAGTTEQRLSCAIDVAQGHGHGMTPDEYARAKQAAALIGGAQ